MSFGTSACLLGGASDTTPAPSSPNQTETGDQRAVEVWTASLRAAVQAKRDPFLAELKGLFRQCTTAPQSIGGPEVTRIKTLSEAVVEAEYDAVNAFTSAHPYPGLGVPPTYSSGPTMKALHEAKLECVQAKQRANLSVPTAPTPDKMEADTEPEDPSAATEEPDDPPGCSDGIDEDLWDELRDNTLATQVINCSAACVDKGRTHSGGAVPFLDCQHDACTWACMSELAVHQSTVARRSIKKCGARSKKLFRDLRELAQHYKAGSNCFKSSMCTDAAGYERCRGRLLRGGE